MAHWISSGIAAAALIVLAPLVPPANSAGDPAFACPGGATYPVTLTFDDGPHPTLTPRVLDVLKKRKLPGTFFVLGERFGSEAGKKQSIPLLDRMRAEGHVIGSHTYNHIAHNSVSAEKAKANIDRATAVLKDYLNPVLRLPYGAGSFKANSPQRQVINDRVMQLVKDAGFSHVGWEIDTNDWDPKKRPYILQTMMREICSNKGGIILFHDIQPNTVEHLDEWIEAILKQGHEIVGLERFISRARKPFSRPKSATPDSCKLNRSHPCSDDADRLELLIQEIMLKGAK